MGLLRSIRPPEAVGLLTQLGFAPGDGASLAQAMVGAPGLVLVVGPASSGKTTTLHTLARSLNPSARIIALGPGAAPRADGQNWEILSLRHVRTDSSRRRAFARVLPAGPHVLLLDEIRSPAIARLALAAVARGTLVLGAVLAERAHQAFDALERLGTQRNELAAALSTIVGQCLIPALCLSCAQADTSSLVRGVLAPATNTWLEGKSVRARGPRPGGCEHCLGQGYRGRLLAYEVLRGDATVRAMLEEGVRGRALEQALLAPGTSLWDRGIGLLAAGKTSLEALRQFVREPD